MKKKLTELKKETDIKIQQSLPHLHAIIERKTKKKINKEKEYFNNNFSNAISRWGLKVLSGRLYTTVKQVTYSS